MHKNLKAMLHSGRAKARWAFEPVCAMQFADNIKRDKLVKQTLKKQWWKLIEVWECEIKAKKMEKTLEKLVVKLKYSTS